MDHDARSFQALSIDLQNTRSEIASVDVFLVTELFNESQNLSLISIVSGNASTNKNGLMAFASSFS
ncbi:hypothetical protein V1477_010267 [Vespula maculifrons]|uniref:Uncharacterized protein n=1 Tax=Vespula maculifrons TaxID=7453 RepID=A0ABD2C818_VESMC